MADHLKERIGFLGGSFDPIHFGHLNLAIEMLERHRLTEVIFCPSSVSPFKVQNPPAAPGDDRLAMLRLALEGVPVFSIWEHELSVLGPSFTIDSIRKIKEEKKHAEIHLLIGTDALQGFHNWKEAEELIKLAPPLIGTRPNETLVISSLPAFVQGPAKKGLTTIPLMDISSTVIRKRLKRGLFCGHLVPFKVLEYISNKRLYEE